MSEERRVAQEEHFGYIRGKVESIQKELTEFKTEVRSLLETHIRKEEESTKQIQEQLNMYRFMWMTVKTLGAVLVLALTLSFGDIVKLFK